MVGGTAEVGVVNLFLNRRSAVEKVRGMLWAGRTTNLVGTQVPNRVLSVAPTVIIYFPQKS